MPGDAPEAIASGPTVADPSTAAEALATLARYAIPLSDAVRDWLQSPAAETLKPGDPRLARTRFDIIATAEDSLAAAATLARAKGFEVIALGDRIEGEARTVAAEHAALARQVLQRPAGSPPCVILSGGETTVTVRGNGRGGRNAEFLLALLLELRGHERVWALAADTDGIDGSEDNAGALFGPDSWERARALGVDLAALLENNDGYGAFERLGELVVTGPTRTNVNDFRAVVIQ